jgi:hypothetical protein
MADMTARQHIDATRDVYLNALRTAVRAAKAAGEFLGAEVGVRAPAAPDDAPSSPGGQVFRIDLLTGTSDKPQPVMVAHQQPSGPLVGALRQGTIEVAVYPLAWEACRVWCRHPEPDWRALYAWYHEWIDLAGDKEPDDDGLSGVVHYLSDPRPEGGGWLTEVDLGSAPVAALTALLQVLSDLGATDVRLGTADGADLDPAAADALRAPDLSAEAFTAVVADLLRSLDEVESLQIVEPLVIRMRTQGAREQSTAHLDNLWRRIQRIEPAQRLREVDRYLRMHRESAQHVVGGLKPDLESLRPVIKSSLFLEGVRQQMRPAREAADGPRDGGTPDAARVADEAKSAADGGPLPLVCRPLAGDLWVLYVWDRPNGMQFVTATEPAEFGLSADEFHARAMANYLGSHRAIDLQADGAAVAVRTHDNYDASLLLDDTFWEGQLQSMADGAAGPAKPDAAGGQADDQVTLLAAVPSRDVVLMARLEIPGAERKLRDLIARHLQAGDHLISATILRRTGGGWAVYATAGPAVRAGGAGGVPPGGPAARPKKKPWWKFW